MSAATRRTHNRAMNDAIEFERLFPPECWEVWEFAGSIRRMRDEVGDVEHVVIAKRGIVTAGLFGEEVNLLWHHLDALVAGHVVSKHLYGDTGYRWGEKYRGVDFRGFNHEIFLADADNWGPTFAIRTGPAEFSQRLVTNLRRNGMCNRKGKVWQCHPCPCGGSPPGGVKCPDCDDGLILDAAVSVPDEKEYFRLCGLKYIEPEKRF